MISLGDVDWRWRLSTAISMSDQRCSVYAHTTTDTVAGVVNRGRPIGGTTADPRVLATLSTVTVRRP